MKYPDRNPNRSPNQRNRPHWAAAAPTFFPSFFSSPRSPKHIQGDFLPDVIQGGIRSCERSLFATHPRTPPPALLSSRSRPVDPPVPRPEAPVLRRLLAFFFFLHTVHVLSPLQLAISSSFPSASDAPTFSPLRRNVGPFFVGLEFFFLLFFPERRVQELFVFLPP